jgi:hypothetical protein
MFRISSVSVSFALGIEEEDRKRDGAGKPVV